MKNIIKKCKKGHEFSNRRQCDVCQKIARKRFYSDNRAAALEYAKKYRRENLKILCQKDKDRYCRNKEYFSSKNKKWKKENAARNTYNSNLYYSRKIKACPKWLNDEHKKQIKEFYDRAAELELMYGCKYNVDHIVPLKGDNVCGLHVPWNLQILKKEDNIKKSNKF